MVPSSHFTESTQATKVQAPGCPLSSHIQELQANLKDCLGMQTCLTSTGGFLESSLETKATRATKVAIKKTVFIMSYSKTVDF